MMPDRSGAFEVKDSAMITIALGVSAQNLSELRDGVAQAPLGCIYHHCFQTLLRHTFDDPEYRNDFALWARRQLHDFHLAERFDVIEPIDYQDIEDLRRHLLEVIDGRLSELTYVPTAAPARQFALTTNRSSHRAQSGDTRATLVAHPKACDWQHFLSLRGSANAESGQAGRLLPLARRVGGVHRAGSAASWGR